eukprot:gene2678-8236_t
MEAYEVLWLLTVFGMCVFPCAICAVCRCWRRLVARTFREGEGEGERGRKGLIVPLSAMLVAFLLPRTSGMISVLFSEEFGGLYAPATCRTAAPCNGSAEDWYSPGVHKVACDAAGLPPPGCRCAHFRGLVYQFPDECVIEPYPRVHKAAGPLLLLVAFGALLLWPLATRRLPLPLCEAAMLTAAAGVVVLDWAGAAEGLGGVWPLNV